MPIQIQIPGFPQIESEGKTFFQVGEHLVYAQLLSVDEPDANIRQVDSYQHFTKEAARRCAGLHGLRIPDPLEFLSMIQQIDPESSGARLKNRIRIPFAGFSSESQSYAVGTTACFWSSEKDDGLSNVFSIDAKSTKLHSYAMANKFFYPVLCFK